MHPTTVQKVTAEGDSLARLTREEAGDIVAGMIRNMDRVRGDRAAGIQMRGLIILTQVRIITVLLKEEWAEEGVPGTVRGDMSKEADIVAVEDMAGIIIRKGMVTIPSMTWTMNTLQILKILRAWRDSTALGVTCTRKVIVTGIQFTATGEGARNMAVQRDIMEGHPGTLLVMAAGKMKTTPTTTDMLAEVQAFKGACMSHSSHLDVSMEWAPVAMDMKGVTVDRAPIAIKADMVDSAECPTPTATVI